MDRCVRRFCLFFAVFLGAVTILLPVSWAATNTAVIRVMHRPAGELLEATRAILSVEGTVVVDTPNNTLIVMDDPATLAKVRELVKSLDVQARQVRLSVTFFETTDTSRMDLLVRWRYVGGGFWVGDWALGGGEGLSVAGRIGALVENTSTLTTQELLTMSGGSGTFFTGRNVPVSETVLTFLRRGGVVVERNVVFREVSTGFTFVPTILADAVHIQITPVMSYMTDEKSGSIVFYESRTTVIIPPGETVVITGDKTEAGRTVRDFFSGFSSSGSTRNFYIALTPHIED